MAKNLEKLNTILKKKARGRKVYNYVVPDLWNCFDYQGKEQIKTPWGELIVNPFKFYSDLVSNYIMKGHEGRDYSQPLSQALGLDTANGEWIRKASVYSTMIRTSAAYDHDRSGKLDDENIYGVNEGGTFVKMLALLPLLQKMGIDTLYMLPISQFSTKDKKGDLGSPYGVSNFFKIDPALKDKMIGEEMTLEEEFSAFVEACHMVGIRVLIDIIPRTNSVNSDLIVSNPDWFYWIKYEELENYRPPYVDGVAPTTAPKPEYFEAVYNSHEVIEHINKFVVNPKDSMPKKWNKVVKMWKEANGSIEILDLVRSELGLTIAPAFSDHINDVQPPWTDITFFRMYNDHPIEAVNRLHNPDTAPYILYDTIKSSWHPGLEPNQELWDTLSAIIPYFQENFGIDGARIDMGHALPSPLVDQIIKAAKDYDEDFTFIAEQLDSSLASVEKENGYNMIIGMGFHDGPRIWTGHANAYYYGLAQLETPVFACGETHDTPRIAARPEGGKPLSKLLTTLNMFMPNGVPFINSGQEFYEMQPMNTGIDCRDNEMYMLEKDDPYYGKLALFDKYQLHYTNPDRWDLVDMLERLSGIRQEYLSTLTNSANFQGLGFSSPSDMAIGLGYVIEGQYNQEMDNLILVIANTNVYEGRSIYVNIEDIRSKSSNSNRMGKLIFSTHEWERDVHEFDYDGNLNLYMAAGEVKIIKL